MNEECILNLVVGCRKGPATFRISPTAHRCEYDFWLGRCLCFRRLAVTTTKNGHYLPRVPGVSGSRHFRELGPQCARPIPVTVIGIGDWPAMCSQRACCVSQPEAGSGFTKSPAYLNRSPDPAPKAAFKRNASGCFDAASLELGDYDKKLISAGGGIVRTQPSSNYPDKQYAEAV